jgi:iron complex transport system substrate-binding protein
VFTFNQRSVDDILQMVRILGGIVGVPDKANAFAAELRAGLDDIRARAAALPRRPRVYFEEWDNPLISGIQWVEELIEIAGGIPVFPDLRQARLATNRIVTSEQVIAAAPDVIIGSWCGKPVRKEKIAARDGWNTIPAVSDGQIHEVKSTYILQPGPASLTDGVSQLHTIVTNWARQRA